MLSRRSLFPALAAAAVSAPTLALAGDYIPVPDVYLARSELVLRDHPLAKEVWRETWLNSVDPAWSRTLVTGSSEITPYAQRHAMMLELYKEDHRR